MRLACFRPTPVLALALVPLGGWSRRSPPPPPPLASSVTKPGGSGLGGACADNPRFLLGSGLYDITGPAAEVGMMGDAQVGQQTEGIHTVE